MKRNILYMVGALLSSAILTFGCSEDDIPSYSDVSVDKNDLFIKIENPTAEVNITNGNGNYKVTVADENIATATLDGTRITINGLKNGTTTATVMDWAKRSTVINIRVKEDFELALDKEEVTLFLNKEEENDKKENTALVTIISGNGDYQLESSNNEVATAEMTEDGKILITGLSSDFCDVTVTDGDGNKAIIKVGVCAEHLVLEDIKGKTCVINQTLDIAITTGNDNYSVVSENPEIATAEMAEGVIRVTGVSKGEANITVTDRMKQTATVKVKVAGDFEIESTQIDNLWIGEGQEIAIIDGSGDYTISSGASMTCTLSADQSKFVINGVEKKMALNQTISITDKVFEKTITINVKCIDYAFEKDVARWFVQGAFGIPGSCSIDESNGTITIKAGEYYKPFFGNAYIRNGYVISFKGDRTEGQKTDGTLHPLNNSGKNGTEIKISNVVMEKVKYDEGNEPNGFFWIKFREEGKDYDSYIVAHT